MKYELLKSAVVYETKGVEGRLLAATTPLEYVRLSLQPGGTIPAHRLPIYVDFFVIAGRGKVLVETVTTPIAEGDLLTTNPHEERSVINTGNVPLELLVIKQNAASQKEKL